MQKNKEAIVLLNMGGARSKKELEVFLTNMFNDQYFSTNKNSIVRKISAYYMVNKQIDSKWENYQQIANYPNVYDLAQKLVDKCNKKIEGFKTYYVMRYTEPYSKDILKQIKDDGIDTIILCPLFAHYSFPTRWSCIEDFIIMDLGPIKTGIVGPYYTYESINNIIVKDIVKSVQNTSDYNLIFSAYAIPFNDIDKYTDGGEPYEKQLIEHVEILKNILQTKGINFKSINLAYQSKTENTQWLEPSLESILENYKEQNVLLYPISFIIDNYETLFELDIKYREIANNLGIKDYKVCKCINDNDDFVEFIKNYLNEME